MSLKLDKISFFNQRKLPKESYYYNYNGQNYVISMDDVISSIGYTEEKCLFLLNELNASDDFLINVYLQDLAYECMQIYIRNNLVDEISTSLLDKREKYKFTLNTVEYIAYQDDEGKYHVDQIGEVGKYAGWARYSRFEERLYTLLNSRTFECIKIEKPQGLTLD